MKTSLPETWIMCEIGAVAAVVGGGTPPSKDPSNFDNENGISWITPADLSGYRGMYISAGARRLSQRGLEVSSAVLLPEGTVLFSSRAPIGYTAIAAAPLATSQGFKSFVLAEGIDNRYVYFYLRHITPLVQERATGTTFKEISAAAASRLPLALAPESEQERIADKLVSVVPVAEELLEALGKVPPLVSRLRRRIVSAAMQPSRRTSKGDDSHAASNSRMHPGWAHHLLGDLCKADRPITYGVIKLGNEVPTGVPCLRTSNVRWLRIDAENVKHIAPALSAQHGRTILQGGEVLVNVRGTLGGVTAVGVEMAGWNVSREIAVVGVDPHKVDAAYLALWIASDASQRWLSRMQKGVTYRGINIEDLRSLPVSLPSIAEQRRIVREVNRRTASLDEIEARVELLTSRATRLVPAVLASAFHGDLIPQKDIDEPASELLARAVAMRKETGLFARPRKPAHKRVHGTHADGASRMNRDQIPGDHLRTILQTEGPLDAKALWLLSLLTIDDFYDQLKREEEDGLVVERDLDSDGSSRTLEVVQ